MEFKKAVREDKEELLAFYHSFVGMEYCTWTMDYPGEAQIEYDLSRDSLFCMKNEKGEIIGTITLDLDERVEAVGCWSASLAPSVELSRLGVRTDYQNQGIARELLKNAMEEAKRRGMKSVHFLVCKNNVKALRSYDKLNFHVAGECDLFDEPWWCYEKEV